MNLAELQVAQAAYDQDHWDHEPGAPTVVHSALHLAKTVGKMAAIAEVLDHDGEHGEPDFTALDREVIPDLLIYAARLANNRGISLEEALAARTAELRQRFGRPEQS